VLGTQWLHLNSTYLVAPTMQMLERYAEKGCPTEYPVRTKCIALFQEIHGVDTLLFAVYVHEYGQDCAAPNRRRVYISYLDSVKYFEPKCYRTVAYHTVLLEYLRYVKNRGFHTAHIWSCPPTADDDYIFCAHPSHQLTPREDMLRAWYHRILDRAKGEGIVLRTSTLYDEYFVKDGVDSVSWSVSDPTCLPYFEGDYIPGEIENIIRLEKGGRWNDAYESSGDTVMARLGHNLGKMKENFIVVHLRSRRFAAAVERGEDVSNWVDGSDEEIVRSKRAKISGKDSSVLHQSRVLKEETTQPESMTLKRSAMGLSSSSIGSPTDSPALYINSVEKESAARATETNLDVRDGVSSFPELSGSAELTAGTKSDGLRVVNRAASQSNENALSSIADSENVDASRNPEGIDRNEVMAVVGKMTGALSPNGANITDAPVRLGDDGTSVTGLEMVSDGNAELESPAGITANPEETAILDSQIAAVAGGYKIGEIASSIDLDEASDVLLATDWDPGSIATDEATVASPVVAIDSKSLEIVATEASVPILLERKHKEFISMEHDDGVDDKSLNSPATKRNFDDIEPALSRHLENVKHAVKVVANTADEDEPLENELFESRQRFLNYCQTTHCQFDELRRAKHSTMMVLFQLHNPTAPLFLHQCGACYRDITHGVRFHCGSCSNFDLCQECYEPVTSGLWAKRDPRFGHDQSHTFAPVDMEASAKSGMSLDERRDSLQAHVALLEHAGSCLGAPGCSLHNCQRVKSLFAHVGSCEVDPKADCRICTRLFSLCAMHSRRCSLRGECPVPFCDRIRERNKRIRLQQELMDDRRRQAQNDLYHATGT
jgi:hypothetical protein